MFYRIYLDDIWSARGRQKQNSTIIKFRVFLMPLLAINIKALLSHNSLYNSKFTVFYAKENDSLTEMYELPTITDILRFDIMQMVKNNTELKICRHCNLPFIPKGRADSVYCDRIANGEAKPCNEIGALNVFKSNQENDKIFKAYQKAYRRMYSRKRMKTISPEEFKSWGKQARALRKDCYNGKLTFEEYVVWLEG